MKKKLIILLLIVPVVVVVDQITKMLILEQFQFNESREIISGFFNLTYVRNPGAAFGFLRDTPDIFRKSFFLALTPVMLIFLGYLFVTTSIKKVYQLSAIALIIGGAVGNYIDRLRFSYVVDFLDFYYKSWHYPAFNVADMAIVTGVLSLLLISAGEEIKTKKANVSGH